jgi:hypothetical protein
MVEFKAFDQVYQAAAAEALALWTPEMQGLIARHNAGWSVGRTDFGVYLRASAGRYFRAYQALASRGALSVCDVGGFWGVWPVTLARLGLRVAMTEARAYYGPAFDPLFALAKAAGVLVHDYDPFGPEPFGPDRFAAVTSMAVLEHYPYSLKRRLAHMTGMLEPGGLLYVEVPNLAYWPKRWGLLRGRTPLPPMVDVWESAEPYTGHHREFVRGDLRELARLAGLTILAEDSYNLSDCRSVWDAPLTRLAYRYLPNAREILTMLCAVRSACP